ncbi:uncharacterized protein [Lepeophtheirus salmonis]|uniref:uncharacterized protein n=1 Tax=Lepeophtheirus salmonis TaxID=72036 RepID=UPI003AF3AEB5
MEDIPIIELDSLEFGNEESWLVSAPCSSTSTEDFNFTKDISPPPALRPSSTLRKKTLLQKIDEINNRSNYYSNGYTSPRRQLCSTPVRNNPMELYTSPINFQCSDFQKSSHHAFDSRTFTRKAGAKVEKKLLSFSTDETDCLLFDKKLNLTFEKLDLNYTFDKGPASSSESNNSAFTKADEGLNRTYCADESNPVNLTYDATNSDSLPVLNENNNLNTTFQLKRNDSINSNRKMSEDRLSSSSIPADGNMCLSREESSSHGELDDALSTTSDSSVSHRLNDVGDVQHIAKLQEESLKESPIVQSQQQSYIRSATISPSSEHSPLTEEGNPVYDPSEDGSLVNDNVGNCPPSNTNNVRYQQYSSQDSLPDSPYSSQSLDSQPASGQDRLRRSMPNLNKIRQNRGRGGTRGLPVPPSMGGRPAYYGPDSGHALTHRRSLAGMYQQRSHTTRGGVLTHQSASDSNLRNRSVSTVAAPRPLMGPPLSVIRSTGIPRPGSRIPAPSGIPRSSGIPKPSSGSGSRLPTSLRKTSLSGIHRPGQYN